MPLPSWLYGNALGNIGDAAGTFPPPPVFKVLGNIGERTAEPTAPYIGAFGPRSVTGQLPQILLYAGSAQRHRARTRIAGWTARPGAGSV